MRNVVRKVTYKYTKTKRVHAVTYALNDKDLWVVEGTARVEPDEAEHRTEEEAHEGNHQQLLLVLPLIIQRPVQEHNRLAHARRLEARAGSQSTKLALHGKEPRVRPRGARAVPAPVVRERRDSVHEIALQLALTPHCASPARSRLRSADGEQTSAQYLPLGPWSAHVGLAVTPLGTSVGHAPDEEHWGEHILPLMPWTWTASSPDWHEPVALGSS